MKKKLCELAKLASGGPKKKDFIFFFQTWLEITCDIICCFEVSS
jgi:hypothetical protein